MKALKRFQCFDTVGWVAGRASSLKKTKWWGAGMVICLALGAYLHMAQLMQLPLTVSCFSKIQIGFTLGLLVPAHLGSPGQRAVKRVGVCVCVCVCVCDNGPTDNANGTDQVQFRIARSLLGVPGMIGQLPGDC